MNKFEYVLHSKEMGYFNPKSSSGHLDYGRYPEDFKDTLSKAVRYKTKETAFEKMRALMEEVPDITIMEVNVSISVVGVHTIEDMRSHDAVFLKELRDWIKSIDDMTSDERDEIPKKEWIRYKNAKRHMQAFDEGDLQDWPLAELAALT